MSTWRRVLTVLVLLAGTVLAAAPAQAATSTRAQVPVLDNPLDCKEAPTPASPQGHPLSVRPQTTSSADPFAQGSTTSIYSVYGTGYTWVTYDTGCSPGAGILPGMGTATANAFGLEVPAMLTSLGRSMQNLVVSPQSWIGVVDQPVAAATSAVAGGFWRPWLTVALLLVAAVVLTRSSRGQLAGALSAGVWALLVLVLSTWLVNYPTEATALVDDGVQTATVEIARGFSGGGEGDAATVIDRQWDQIDRATNYDTWLTGTFGSSTSATAKAYGPRIFKATHLSWAEQDRYDADPTGAGADLLEAKGKAFQTAADQVKEADPIAYDYLTGNRWSKRLTAGLTNWILFLATSLFMIVAGVGMLLAYLVIRLVVPIAPVAGIVFLLDGMRDVAVGQLRRVAAIIVMGPAYLVAALVTLRFNSAIIASDSLPTVVKVLFVAAISFVAWKLIRPASVAGMSGRLGRMLRTAAAVKLGTRGLADDRQSTPETGQDRTAQTYRRSRPDHPVAQPAPATLPPGTTDLPHYEATPVAPGTFTNRPAVQPQHLPHRQARALPAPQTAGPSSTDVSLVDDAHPATFTRPALGLPAEPATRLDDVEASETAGPPSPPPPSPEGGQHLETDGAGPSVAATAPAAGPSPSFSRAGPLTGSIANKGDGPTTEHEANKVWVEDVGFVHVIYRPSTSVRKVSDV